MSAPREPLVSAVPVGLYQLPAAVQNTLQQHTQGGSIDNIERGLVQGQPVYQATLRRNGQPIELRVDENGNLVRDVVNDQYLAGIGQLPNTSTIGQSPISISDWRTAPVRQPLLSSRIMDFRSMPQPVRNTFMRYANGGPVDTVRQGMVGGQPIYEAQLRPNGQSIDLRVSESGTLVDDQVNDRFLAQFRTQPTPTSAFGQAPGSQSGSASSFGTTPLTNPTSVSYEQLPIAVQTTLDGQAGGAPIDRVSEGTLNGTTVYEATFNRGSQPLSVRVAADGSVLDSGISAR